jgi:hypothetical protein
MEATPAEIESLKKLTKEMSPADLSVLEGVLQALQEQESVRLVTISGSKNDALWSEMTALNWMKLDGPIEDHAASKVYIVLREARAPLETFLLDLKRDELPKLLDEFRRDIPPLIGPRVIGAGGTPADLVMMLAGIVQSTMRRYVQEDLHEDFLRAVCDRGRDLNQIK